MDTNNVLREIPGITRDLIYSWVLQGYISCISTPMGTRGYKRKNYSPEAVVKLKKMFEYYKQGMSPRVASKLAEQDVSQTLQTITSDSTKSLLNQDNKKEGLTDG